VFPDPSLTVSSTRALFAGQDSLYRDFRQSNNQCRHEGWDAPPSRRYEHQDPGTPSPDKTDPTKRAIFWIFGFTQKQGPKISEVEIEEVYSDKPDRLVTTDVSPALKDNEWSTHTEAVVIGESTTLWLYEKKNSAFMFKFTVQFEGGGESVLYQMSIFPSQAKTHLVQPLKEK
jgi:hypothetical protein